MKIFFEKLHRKNILNTKGINVKRILTLSPKQIRGLCEELIMVIKKPDQAPRQNIFTHSASMSLGGGIEDCMNLGCRFRNLDSLARYALMYSDKVYIDNFLARHIHKGGDTASIHREFYNDIYLLAYIQPLLENGIIALFVSPEHWCPYCIAESSFGKDARKRVENTRKHLTKEYFLNTTVKLGYRNNRYRLKCIGREPYFEHGGLIYETDKPHNALRSASRIIDRAKEGEEVPLPRYIKEKLKLHKIFANQALKNICFELTVAQANNTSFLTNKDLHLTLLKEISNDLGIEERNKIARDCLTIAVPFLEDVDIKNLVRLRSREYESLVVFRQTLNTAIEEFKKTKSNFSVKDAQTLYRDVINPQLVSLERRIKNAKKDLVNKAYRSALAYVGALSFGLYFKFIPSEIMALASSVGIIKFGTDFLKQVMEDSNVENTVRNDNLFFLWKVNELSKIIPKKNFKP